jgi:ferric-dicitrate binding protein FerR (iron transport regulator)
VSIQCTRYFLRIWVHRGEAAFHITHDASRTVTVFTPDAELIDLGTDFSVRVEPRRTAISVFTGFIHVSAITKAAALAPQKGAPNGGRVVDHGPVYAGETATVIRSGSVPQLRIQPIPPFKLEHGLDWEYGRLSFSAEPLSEVIRDINRYNRVQLQFDPRIGCWTLGLVGVPANNVPYILRKLHEIGIDSTPQPGDNILLRAHESKSADCSHAQRAP